MKSDLAIFVKSFIDGCRPFRIESWNGPIKSSQKGALIEAFYELVIIEHGICPLGQM